MIRSLAFTVLLAGAVIPGPARADAPPSRREALTLAERLKTGLEAKRPEDFTFADRVAAMVHAGTLPAKIVDSAFLWAREHGGSYPFPSFRRALSAQAALIGVRL